MSEFDEWFKRQTINVHNDVDNSLQKYWASIGYEAGQQSQQAKIDELQARVDEALKMMDAESSNSWGLWKEKADMYEQGASNAYEKSYWILKGNKDEN